MQTKTALDAGEQAHWNEMVTWSDISESHTTLKLEVWEDDELKEVREARAEGKCGTSCKGEGVGGRWKDGVGEGRGILGHSE